ncbi:SusD family protein [bacterium A37T11]|nr:SusD family protein [bacterium A37T11]
MKRTYIFLVIISFVFPFISCKKYLDAKPNKALVIPQKLSDLQKIVDNDGLMNETDPHIAEIACDDYYVVSTFYPILSTIEQDIYTWNPGVRSDLCWINTYQKIYMSNLILDYLDEVVNDGDLNTYNSIKGAAYFIRGFSLFTGAQVYTLPYNKGVNENELGMPIKISSDINSPTSRSFLKETYDQITSDLKLACEYLPADISPITRPSKAVSYLVLANVYLQMQEYSLAATYADSCLRLKNLLIDFNSLDTNSPNPISRGNSEVLYESNIISSLPLNAFLSRVDSNLYKSYNQNDLRKLIFYQDNGDGTASFKGGYIGNITSQALYSGASVDEAYLIKAECSARLNDLKEASDKLNGLLLKRFKTGSFQPYRFTDQVIALRTILDERRKELAFRGGRRWWDLRRLNIDPALATTLRRIINGTIVELPPNDLRYAFLIPEQSITVGNIDQNAR